MSVNLDKPALSRRAAARAADFPAPVCRVDMTRTAAARARTLSRRTERRLRIARNAAALFGLVAFADEMPAAALAR